MPIVGYDATPVEVTDLQDGVFTALIAQEPYQEGYQAVSVLTALHPSPDHEGTDPLPLRNRRGRGDEGEPQ